MAKNPKPNVFYGWIIVAASLAVTTTAFGILYSFGVFFSYWIKEWDCSRAFLSGVFSLAFLIYGISSFFMGNLTDRVGPRKTLLLGGAIMGCGAILTSLVSAAWLLYLTFGLMIGIGVGTSYSPTASTVSRWFVQKRGTAVGLVVAGLGLGTLIYPPLAAFVTRGFSWRVTFVIFGLAILIVFFGAAYLIRRDPKELGLHALGEVTSSARSTGISNPTSSSQLPGVNVKRALRSSHFWILFFIHLLWVMGMVIPMVHLVPYATDNGISPDLATFMLAVTGGISVLGRVALGSLGERIGLKTSLLLMLLVQMLTMVWLSMSKSVWMLWLFSFTFGFSYGGLASLIPLMTNRYFGFFAMGSIFGLILLGATVGGTIGPWLAGFIFDVTSKYFWGFLAGAGSMGVSLLLGLSLPSSSLSVDDLVGR